MNMIIWLIICIVLIIIEASTLNLVSIWFAIGSGAAYLCSLLGLTFWPQFWVFTFVSLALLFFTRPLVRKYMNSHYVKTNVDSLIGQYAKVVADVNNMEGFGTAIVNGMEWSAISSDDDIVFHKGDSAVITAVKGVKLILSQPPSNWQ